MNIKKHFEKIFFLFFLILLHFQFAVAQSEKVDKTANPSVPCVQTIETDSTENKTNLVDFPSYKYVVSENVTDFIKQLNELGKCGYRLENLTKAPQNTGKTFSELNLAAIVKLDIPNKYEYDWFEAFTPGEVTSRLNYRAKKGFRIRDSIKAVAASRSPTDSASSDDFDKIYAGIIDILSVTAGNIFFLERKNNNAADLGDSRVVIGRWGWGKSPTKELQIELENTFESGFSPVKMGFGKILNKYAVFLIMTGNETIPESEEKNNLTYQIFKSEYGFEKKVNRLAEKGFKILFYDHYGAKGFVTMVKESQPTDLVSYQLVDVTEKNWQDKIINLSKHGSVYKTVGTAAINSYPDTFEGNLLFEKPLVDNNKRFEYKILKMSKDFKKFQNNPFELLSASEETMTEFNLLLKEGFIIRDLFFAEGVNVLFERDTKQTVEKTVDE